MYRIIRGLGICVSSLSPGGLERLARACAVLSFDIVRFRRRLILRNLEMALGAETTPAERVRIGRASMKHFMLNVFEFLGAVRRDMLDDLTVEGAESVWRALEEGQGAYILCCHLGNWEAMGAAGTRLAAPTHALVKEVGEGGANRLVDELRRKSGLYPIYRRPAGAAMRALRAALDRNELVAFMLDQAVRGAPRLPFFGHPAKTQTSLAAIWRKTPRSIFPVSIQRVAPRRHRLTVWPQVPAKKTGDSKQDVLDITAQCNLMIEKMIRTCPEQYFWIHDRWK